MRFALGVGGQKFLSKPLILPALPLSSHNCATFPSHALCKLLFPRLLCPFGDQCHVYGCEQIWKTLSISFKAYFENYINIFQGLSWKLYQYLPELILDIISISSRAYLGQFINIIQSLSWKAQGLALAFMVRALTGGDSCYKVQLVTILQKIKFQEITMKFEL